MAIKRKTRKEKIRSSKRMEESLAFKINDNWLTKSGKSSNSPAILTGSELNFFKTDLTKTLFLTMLVLAVELALWQILSRH